MFDQVPPQIWIVLALAIISLGPAAYVWRYIAHGLTPRDITLPPEDLSWKSLRHFLLCLTALVGLAGIGAFVFTPWAAQFARSPLFAQALFGAMGSYALCTVVWSWRKGEIELLLRGFVSRFSRTEHPKRYWASMIWNGILGAGLLAAAFGAGRENATPHCDDGNSRDELIEILATCSALLAESDLDLDQRANLLADRGAINHRLGNDTLALRDYSDALALDPSNSYALYNRALVYQRTKDFSRSLADFDASLALRPDNDAAYLDRGLLYLDHGRLEEAVRDFTTLHERSPDNAYALANRGITYVWLGEREKAEKDFATINKDGEAWPIVLHGRALLAFHDKEYSRSIDYLTQALNVDPDDYFALRLRADAYWKSGRKDLARNDDDRSIAIDAERDTR